MKKLLLGLCTFFLYGAQTVLAHGGTHPTPAPPPPHPTPVPAPVPVPPTPTPPGAPTPMPPGTPTPQPTTPNPQPATPTPNPGGPLTPGPQPGTPLPTPSGPTPTGPTPVPTHPNPGQPTPSGPLPATPTPQPGTPTPQPATPQSGTPTTPTTPSPQPTPPRPVASPTATGTQPLSHGEKSLLTWEQWWKRHGDIYNFVKKQDTEVTGEKGVATLSPLKQHLVEQLLKNLEDKYYDVRASSAIALGKMGVRTPEVLEALLKTAKDKKTDVRESALLALGMINAVESAPTLSAILRNKRNETSERCFASVALGLMKCPGNYETLQRVFTAPDTKEEVKAGALLGLGLLGDPRAAYTLYPVLTSNYKEELQSLAVTALAKIGRTDLVFRRGRKSVTVDLVTLFERKLVNKVTRKQVRRSIAMALGTMGREESSIAALERAYRTDRDAGVKAFALLSLALIPKSEKSGPAVFHTLRRALKTERNVVVRGFAALAIGLSRDSEGGSLLLDVFTSNERPSVRAAASIGLGLLRYKPALPDLGNEVKKPRDGGEARGYSAVALGMIGEPASSDYLKSVLKNVNVPYLKWASAMGLALLRDRSAVPDILEQLDDKNRITRESAVRSLAYFRDDATVSPLLEQFKKEKSNEVRTMIIVTLGQIADASKDLPILRRVGRNVNWVAARNMAAVDLLTRLF